MISGAWPPRCAPTVDAPQIATQPTTTTDATAPRSRPSTTRMTWVASHVWPSLSTSAVRDGTTATGAVRSTPTSSRRGSGSSTTRRCSTPSRSTTPSTGCPPIRPSRGGSAQAPRGLSVRRQGESLHNRTSRGCARWAGTRSAISTRSSRSRTRRRWDRSCGSSPRASSATTSASARRSRSCRRRVTAFEFRHASWFVDDVYELLRRHRAALVIGDDPERPFQTREITAKWTYVRFHRGNRGRRGNYSNKELEEWRRRICILALRGRGLRLLQQRLGGLRTEERALAQGAPQQLTPTTHWATERLDRAVGDRRGLRSRQPRVNEIPARSAFRTRSATASPVRPTSSRRSAGLPWVT